MKLVKEDISFKRGQDPYDKLGVGKYDDNYDWEKPEANDKIELIEDIYSTQYMEKEIIEYNGEHLTTIKQIEEGLDLKYSKGQIFYFYKADYEWYPIDDDDYPINHHWIIDRNKEIFRKIRN